MANDIQVTRLDVVKEYNSKLKMFRVAALACGATIDRQIRKIKADVGSKQDRAKSKQRTGKGKCDSLVNRYKPVRRESLPGSEVVGDSDHQIQVKYQALEAAVNEYVRTVDTIKAKMDEIGQETKTFCTILDSETQACNRKLEEMIPIMDDMCNLRL